MTTPGADGPMRISERRIIVYAQLNFSENVASAFGTDPFWWYVPVIIVLSGGLAVVGGIGLMLTWRSSWPLFAVGAVTLGAYSAIAHKETRFIFFLIPVWLIGPAAVAANRGELIARSSAHVAGVAPWVGRALIAAFFVISPLGLFNALPMQNRGVNPHIADNDARAAHRALADFDDVTGVLNLVENNPWDLAPGYDLHLNVPIYWRLGFDGFNSAKADPGRYASHVLISASKQGPSGFRPLQTIGTVATWRRITDPPSTLPPPEYTTRMWVPPVRSRPVVNPRW